MPDLCPHDRLAPHCMWCLAETLACEQEALTRLCDDALDPWVVREFGLWDVYQPEPEHDPYDPALEDPDDA